jgi:hypothetical protein
MIQHADMPERERRLYRDLDVEVDRYLYYYKGPPAVLHLWCDVSRDGKQESMPVFSTPLADWARPQQHIRRSGAIYMSYRFAVTPFDHKTVLRVSFDVPEQWSGVRYREPGPKVDIPFDKGAIQAVPGGSCSGKLACGQTMVLYEHAYYTEDHPDVPRLKTGKAVTFNREPGPGKVVLKLKIRLTQFDPSRPEFAARRRDGNVASMDIGW